MDHEILIVGKPDGLLSVPGKGAHLAECLLSRVQAAFPEALLVHRLDRDTSGVMVFALIVDWPNRPRQMVDHENGKAALTEWRVQRSNESETRIRLFPQTGRSHQLRVHMLAIGHPILGDPFYAEGPARKFSRMMLHSESLRLRHPDGGIGMTFKVKTPF